MCVRASSRIVRVFVVEGNRCEVTLLTKRIMCAGAGGDISQIGESLPQSLGGSNPAPGSPRPGVNPTPGGSFSPPAT
jgi:hypothetical protein